MKTQAPTASQAVRHHIRWMIRRDMPEVLAIDRALGRGTTEAEHLALLRVRENIGMVVEAIRGVDTEGPVVGFMIYALGRRQVDLLSFAADPARDPEAVERAMLAKLKGKLSDHRRTALLAEVDGDELGMLALFKSEGFRAELPILTDESGRDGYRMAYRLPERGAAS